MRFQLDESFTLVSVHTVTCVQAVPAGQELGEVTGGTVELDRSISCDEEVNNDGYSTLLSTLFLPC